MPNRISDMNRVPCKFFAQGDCLKGEHCLFSHVSKLPSNNSQKICYFYQKGDCAFGSRCRHQHVKASEAQMSSSSLASSLHTQALDSGPAHPSITASSGVAVVLGTRSELSALSSPFIPPSKPALSDPVVDPSEDNDCGENGNAKPADRAICSLAAAGDCPRGEKCPDVHGDICPSCGKHCLHPSRPTEREEHIKICEENLKQLEALKRSEEIECCVCLERVLSKPTVAERKFGILSECDHPFCISCIRNWRNSSTRSAMDVNSAYRACPTCRKLSYFVIPSVVWYSTKEEKDEIVDSYKARLRLIDCKHFDSGNGNCPFGSSCFYKHTVKPGSYAWTYNRPPPRRPPPRRYDNFQMDSLYDMFDFEDMEDLDDYGPDEETALELQLLMMELGIYPSDTSDDEQDY